MCKKTLPLQSKIGLVLLVVYVLTEQFVCEIPDVLAYPMMIVSCALLLIGVYKQGRWIGESKKQK